MSKHAPSSGSLLKRRNLVLWMSHLGLWVSAVAFHIAKE